MLKITFPHLGNFYIPLRSFWTELGFEPIVPPLTSQRTISLGAKVAPEFACLPLKINLGNYLEAIQAGAECVFMVGGAGPCRFGYYGEVQREILKENGYEADFAVFEAPNHAPRKLWDTMKRYLPWRSFWKLPKAVRILWAKARALDCFDRNLNKIRPLETSPGLCNRLQDNFYSRIDQTASIAGVHSAYREALRELKEIGRPAKEEAPKAVLLGEIFMVLEPRVNFQIERVLGSMGIEVERTIYISDWIRENFLGRYLEPDHKRRLRQLAGPYLRNLVGGHGLESVAHLVDAGINRAHGVIHLAPFTCMPEIVAMQTFGAITNELGIPVLSLIIDEHSAAAGIETRLEAFLDLLKFRRRPKPEPGMIAEEPAQELVFIS
ncbi:MAG: 2-hydroxyacyl-CoA dehydratase [Firmicutes bacterium]|nr:2-hydroxyacyl-CoA dehydratase [Bacillota bacterium]